MQKSWKVYLVKLVIFLLSGRYLLMKGQISVLLLGCLRHNSPKILPGTRDLPFKLGDWEQIQRFNDPFQSIFSLPLKFHWFLHYTYYNTKRAVNQPQLVVSVTLQNFLFKFRILCDGEDVAIQSDPKDPVMCFPLFVNFLSNLPHSTVPYDCCMTRTGRQY